MPEKGTDGEVVPFAVATGHEYLGTDTETEAKHEDGHVVDAGKGRGAEFYFTDTTEESRVREVDHVFHEDGDEDGVGDVPDLSVGVSHGS